MRAVHIYFMCVISVCVRGCCVYLCVFACLWCISVCIFVCVVICMRACVYATYIYFGRAIFVCVCVLNRSSDLGMCYICLCASVR